MLCKNCRKEIIYWDVGTRYVHLNGLLGCYRYRGDSGYATQLEFNEYLYEVQKLW